MPATSCCSRRRAKGARRSKSCGACSTRPARGVPFDEMAVFLRTPQQYLGPARARLRARRRAGLLRSRHAPARSGRPRLRRAAVVRGRRPVGEALRRIPVARPGAAGRPTPPRRPPLVAPLDEVFADEERRSGPLSPPDALGRSRPGRADSNRSTRDDEAVVAGTLRSPWKWEELIVESAVVGGRTREDGKARWRRRLDGLAADFTLPHRRAEEGRAGVGAHRALRARSAEPRAPAPVRAADRRRAGRVAGPRRRGASGSSASARWRARGAAAARRACCRRSPICGRWPTSVR